MYVGTAFFSPISSVVGGRQKIPSVAGHIGRWLKIELEIRETNIKHRKMRKSTLLYDFSCDIKTRILKCKSEYLYKVGGVAIPDKKDKETEEKHEYRKKNNKIQTEQTTIIRLFVPTPNSAPTTPTSGGSFTFSPNLYSLVGVGVGVDSSYRTRPPHPHTHIPDSVWGVGHDTVVELHDPEVPAV